MKDLPRLEPGQAYRASDFEYFEHSQTAIIRLHLKNMTTIDIPASDSELKRLLTYLIEVFGEHAVSYVKQRGLI